METIKSVTKFLKENVEFLQNNEDYGNNYRNKYERKVNIDINPIIKKIQYFMGIGSNYSYIKEMKLFSMNNNVINEYVNLQKEMHKGVDKIRRLSLFGYTISHICQAILNIVIYFIFIICL